MHALYGLAERDEALRPVVPLDIKERIVIGTRATKARGKKPLAKLNRLTA